MRADKQQHFVFCIKPLSTVPLFTAGRHSSELPVFDLADGMEPGIFSFQVNGSY